MIVGVLLSIVPLFFPIIMEVFGLLTGLIQAYIFAILAMVYIASATRTHHEAQSPQQSEEGDETHG
jgi:F-type H+-transporting ATPase subunit a